MTSSNVLRSLSTHDDLSQRSATSFNARRHFQRPATPYNARRPLPTPCEFSQHPMTFHDLTNHQYLRSYAVEERTGLSPCAASSSRSSSHRGALSSLLKVWLFVPSHNPEKEETHYNYQRLMDSTVILTFEVFCSIFLKI